VRIRHVPTRLAVTIAAAALAPMLIAGLWLVTTVRADARQLAAAANHDAATRTAERIRRAIADDAIVLREIAQQELSALPPSRGALARALADGIGHLRRFNGLTLLDASGTLVASTMTPPPRVGVPESSDPQLDGVFVTTDVGPTGLPACRLAVRVLDGARGAAWLVADLDLDGIRRLVVDARPGPEGHAVLIDADDHLLADTTLPAASRRSRGAAAAPLTIPAGGAIAETYRRADGVTQLGTIERIPQLEWRLLVEQPLGRVLAMPTRLQRHVVVGVSLSVLYMIAIGLVVGTRFVAPLSMLERATYAIAAGDFRARVPVSGADAFGRLGNSFNAMADRLAMLQDDVKSQERQVTFGRVVAGLFHDLNQPIQNIGNNARLLLRDGLDADTRRALQDTIDRELVTVRRLMDDLLNVARPRPFDRAPVDVNATAADVMDAVRPQAERAGISLAARCAPGCLMVDADRFALGRVYRNLLSNALQATARGGSVIITTALVGDVVETHVSDTGCGIAPDRLTAIFDDFVTTRRRGLGLGLATSRRIVEQLGGSIAVTSEVGRGSTFTVRFPVSAARAVEAAS
jgi:signal transduction histidine kinase